MREAASPSCLHCGTPLVRLELPEAGFDHPYDLVCFEDACPYYVRGWTWMEERFGVKSSYRYRVDPRSGFASPLAVWSRNALRSSILLEEAPEGAGPKECP